LSLIQEFFSRDNFTMTDIRELLDECIEMSSDDKIPDACLKEKVTYPTDIFQEKIKVFLEIYYQAQGKKQTKKMTILGKRCVVFECYIPNN